MLLRTYFWCSVSWWYFRNHCKSTKCVQISFKGKISRKMEEKKQCTFHIIAREFSTFATALGVRFALFSTLFVTLDSLYATFSTEVFLQLYCFHSYNFCLFLSSNLPIFYFSILHMGNFFFQQVPSDPTSGFINLLRLRVL